MNNYKIPAAEKAKCCAIAINEEIKCLLEIVELRIKRIKTLSEEILNEK